MTDQLHQSVGQTVWGNHIDVLEYYSLSEENGNDFEAHLRYRNSHGEKVLHLASRYCNPDNVPTFDPPSPAGHDPLDRQSRRFRSSTGHQETLRFTSAAVRVRKNILLLLLHSNRSSNCNTRRDDHHPLRAAVQVGDVDNVCDLFYSEMAT